MNVQPTLLQLLHWDFMGRYYGYPQCCIDWFTSTPIGRPLTNQQELVHGNKGFIPCPSCAEKVNQSTIDSLIRNRSCPNAYPKE